MSQGRLASTVAEIPEEARTFINCSIHRSGFSRPVNSGKVSCGRRSRVVEASFVATVWDRAVPQQTNLEFVTGSSNINL